MAQAFIEVDVSQLALLPKAVEQLSGMMGDLREEWRAVTPAIRRRLGVRFTQEGPGWVPLAKSTRADRVRKGYGAGHPILRREGDLRRSFTDGSVQIYEPDWMYYVSPSEIAAYHQWGAPKAKVPPRPIIVVDELAPVVQKAFEDAFVKRANRLWHQATRRGTRAGQSYTSMVKELHGTLGRL